MKIQRHLLFSAILLLFSGFTHAQQNSIKYQNMEVFKIVDGNKTNISFVKNQKTFTMDGRLIREINFEDSTAHILNYTFYFYKDGKLFTEEVHDKNDSILFIIRHTYTLKGMEEETDRLEWSKGKMKISGRTVFIYDKAGYKNAMKESGSRKKPFRVTSYAYSSEKLIREQTKARKPSDNVIERITDYDYGKDGKLMLKKIMEKNVEDTVITQTENYLYNTNGQLKTIEVKDQQGKIVLSKNYDYSADGSLLNYYEKDGAEKVLLYYTYVINYHIINLGTQKSFFDKK
jgi:hypothetical protein